MRREWKKQWRNDVRIEINFVCIITREPLTINWRYILIYFVFFLWLGDNLWAIKFLMLDRCAPQCVPFTWVGICVAHIRLYRTQSIHSFASAGICGVDQFHLSFPNIYIFWFQGPHFELISEWHELDKSIERNNSKWRTVPVYAGNVNVKCSLWMRTKLCISLIVCAFETEPHAPIQHSYSHDTRSVVQVACVCHSPLFRAIGR